MPEDRSWYRSSYDYAEHWRSREWGPLNHRKGKGHPLRTIFKAAAMGHDMGLRWLKEKLYVGAGIKCVEEIHPSDVHFILDAAQSRFSMEWIEGLREHWMRVCAKEIEALARAYTKKLEAKR